jgi:hypothetical protein
MYVHKYITVHQIYIVQHTSDSMRYKPADFLRCEGLKFACTKPNTKSNCVSYQSWIRQLSATLFRCVSEIGSFFAEV